MEGFDFDHEAFEKDGIVIVRQFATPEECDAMMARMDQMIEAWDPEESRHSIFSTNEDQHVNDDYFFGSANKIRFFLEPRSLVDGQFRTDIHKSKMINKVGHGLHLADDVFGKFSRSPRVYQLARCAGLEEPAAPQSMYIFKQAHIGEEVTSHQDSTFLFTEPRLTCTGMWLALEDATLENGCLWARLGSHNEPLRRQFARNPAYWEGGDRTQKGMIFKELSPPVEGQFEGKLPPGDDPAQFGFTALPMKKGDIAVFGGQIDHLSLPNRSEKSRHSFQLHLIESKEPVKWSAENWQQYPEGCSIPKLTGP